MPHQKGSRQDFRNPGLSSPAQISQVLISPSSVTNTRSALVRNTLRKPLLSGDVEVHTIYSDPKVATKSTA